VAAKGLVLNTGPDNNIGKVEFIEEQVSGKISWRKRKIADILEILKQDDNLISLGFNSPKLRFVQHKAKIT
jgi:hypothetical protein